MGYCYNIFTDECREKKHGKNHCNRKSKGRGWENYYLRKSLRRPDYAGPQNVNGRLRSTGKRQLRNGRFPKAAGQTLMTC